MLMGAQYTLMSGPTHVPRPPPPAPAPSAGLPESKACVSIVSVNLSTTEFCAGTATSTLVLDHFPQLSPRHAPPPTRAPCDVLYLAPMRVGMLIGACNPM